mgnify:CR=1 FL=1
MFEFKYFDLEKYLLRKIILKKILFKKKKEIFSTNFGKNDLNSKRYDYLF